MRSESSSSCTSGTFYPDLFVCAKYVQCIGGELIERQCVEGLHFNAAEEMCDWPEYANCVAKEPESPIFDGNVMRYTALCVTK